VAGRGAANCGAGLRRRRNRPEKEAQAGIVVTDIHSNAKGSPLPPPDPDAWPCSRCGQWIDLRFGVCWNCGTTHDGDANPHFSETVDRPESEPTDEPVRSPPQFHLSTALWLTSIAAVAMSVGVSLDSPTVGFYVGVWLLAALETAHMLRDCGPAVVRNAVAIELALLAFFLLTVLNAGAPTPHRRF
jgi:hypothetical protein